MKLRKHEEELCEISKQMNTRPDSVMLNRDCIYTIATEQTLVSAFLLFIEPTQIQMSMSDFDTSSVRSARVL